MLPSRFFPELLARLRIDGNGIAVECGVIDRAFVVEGAAIDDVAAGDALGGSERLGLVAPLQRGARFCQVEGKGGLG